MLKYLSQARDIYEQHEASTTFDNMLLQDGHRVIMDITPDTNTVCGVMVATLARGTKNYIVVSVLGVAPRSESHRTGIVKQRVVTGGCPTPP